ncbi:MAG TPA: nicotinamide-nucleotide amidohydrolase family protein [Pirellulaceae bacterium]|nr:nicotinamide-nucleotide amidohydrolase family protein [Pirellulaceae bacterium]
MSLPSIARRVAHLLEQAERKVVFAESCTGGLVSATLARIAGISNHLCGGVVVYRNATKQAYLQIPADVLEDPGPVSDVVAREMALRVLERTPEADIAASVTGHLGPNAPRYLDGVVFTGIAVRSTNRRASQHVKVRRLRCRTADARPARQRWVTEQLLQWLAAELEALAAAPSPTGRGWG